LHGNPEIAVMELKVQLRLIFKKELAAAADPVAKLAEARRSRIC